MLNFLSSKKREQLQWKGERDDERGARVLTAASSAGTFIIQDEGDETYSVVLTDADGFPIDLRCNIASQSKAKEVAQKMLDDGTTT